MFKTIISNYKNVLIIILLIVSSILYFKNVNIENKLETNQVILTDSLYEYKNKVNELYKEKEAYITNKKDLERINKELYDEIKKLKDNPIVVTKIETVTKIDSIFIESKTEKDSLSNSKINNYNYIDDYISMNLTHKLNNNTGSLFVNNIKMNADITYSIIENKKTNKLSIITKSNNPYLNITDVNGGLINLQNSKTLEQYYRRDNKWNISINGGYGIVYDHVNGRFAVGPTLSIGVSYTLFHL